LPTFANHVTGQLEKNHPSWDFQESKGDSDIEFFKDPEDLRLAASFICINLRASRMRLSSKLLKQHRTSISAWSSEPLAIELFFFFWALPWHDTFLLSTYLNIIQHPDPKISSGRFSSRHAAL
jgi:hypothetical protein